MGTILRTLLLSALFYLLVRVLQYFFGRFLISYSKTQEGEGEGPTLLQCAKCGTWTPKEIVLKRGEQIYCSDKCADGSA
jgi:hypothetical protein